MKKLLQTKLSGLWLIVLLAGSISSWGQATLPTAHNLANSNYTLSTYSSGNSSFPASMAVGTGNGSDGPFNTNLTVDAAKGNANGQWQGEGDNGISYLGGGNNQQGTFLLRTISTGRININVVWTVRDITPNTNTNYIELQWRNGSAGSWNDVTGDLYQQGTTASGTSFNVTLPSSANNLSDLRIRWIYYEIGTGNRERLSIDDITVSSTLPGATVTTNEPVSSGPNDDINSDQAIVRGVANPNGQTVSLFFQYGLTTSYELGEVAAIPTTASGTSSVAFSRMITGLQPSTPYHFRAVLRNPNSAQNEIVAEGQDRTFTTKAYVQSPPIAGAATDVLNTSFVANWSTVPNAQEYRLDVSTSPTFSGTVTADGVVITETFDNIPTTSTSAYTTRTWTGANNISWTATDARTDQTLTGKAIAFRNGELLSGTISGGTSRIRFDMRGAFNDAGSFIVSVLSGPSFGTVTTIGTPSYSGTQSSFDSGNINVTGDYQIRITNNTTGSRVIVDNLAFTGSGTVAASFIEGYNNRLVEGTSVIVQGPEVTQNKQFYYRVRAVNNTHGSTSVNSNVISVTTTNPFVWNGTAWTRTGVPTLSDDVYVEGDFNMDDNYPGTNNINEQKILKAKSLRVSSGTFTISPLTNVLVENEVVVLAPGTLVVESDGSLSQNLSMIPNQGSVTVKRLNSGLFRLDYSLWSSPVTGQNLLDFSPETVINRFYKYDTAQNLYVSSQHVAFNPAAENFQPGTSYLIRMPNTDATPGYNLGNTPLFYPGEFNGTLNNGNVIVNVSDAGNGFNAVGNPYASPIDADQFLLLNAQSADPVTGNTLYFWRKRNAVEGDFYATYTQLGGTRASGTTANGTVLNTEIPNGSIQTGQGFIVKVLPGKGGNRTLFTNGMREVKNTGQFFRTGNTTVEKHRIWFNFTSPEGLVYNSLVGYMENAVNGTDFTDGNRFNTANDGFYSVIEGGQYAVQGRALPFDDRDEVAMGYKANNPGSYTITLDNMDGMFLQDMPVYIKDNVTGTLHNIKDGAYTFATEAGTFNDRFTIVYTDAPAMNVNDNTLTANNVVVYKQGTTLTINTGKLNMMGVTIFDIQGRAIYNATDVNAGELVITDLQSQQQVLLVQVNTPQGTVSKKVIF